MYAPAAAAANRDLSVLLIPLAIAIAVTVTAAAVFFQIPKHIMVAWARYISRYYLYLDIRSAAKQTVLC